MSKVVSSSILNTQYTPKAMLVVYKNHRGESYLEAHPINEDGVPGVAMPVSHDFINNVLNHFTSTVSKTPHGPMPANMLYADTRPGQERYVWWNAPRKRMQYFKESLSLEDAQYPVPGVVYDVSRQKLSVYAFAGRKPKGGSQLLEGPFFNVTKGHVCLGSAKLNAPSRLTWDAFQEYWEKLFWGSVNVHLGSNPLKENKKNPAKSNLVLVLKDSLKEGSFDTDLLKPIPGLTLNKLING